MSRNAKPIHLYAYNLTGDFEIYATANYRVGKDGYMTANSRTNVTQQFLRIVKELELSHEDITTALRDDGAEGEA